jgi:hypothetical protein
MKRISLFIALMTISFGMTAQTRIYVKQDASGSNNGSSWADAYISLQSALSTAIGGDLIYVAKGTYTPDIEVGGAGNLFKCFQLKNGVTVYGGFAGNEDLLTFDLADRDFTTNETILSGDLGSEINVYHVFRHVNLSLNNTAILDGFTVSGGKANGSDPNIKGGGMLNSGTSTANGSSPAIRNCVFLNNQATQGGAIYNSRYCNPVISNTSFNNNLASDIGGAVFLIRNNTNFNGCTFQYNTAQATGPSKGGGAVYIGTSANTEGTAFTNCTFIGNTVNKSSSGARGGAIHASVNPGFLTITGSVFTENEAEYGGAVYQNCGSYGNRLASDVIISNSIFEQNNAMYGGAVFNDGHNTIVTSCIIRGNESTQQSGGYYSRYASSESKITNSLISGNRAALHGGGVYFNTDSTEIVNTTISGNFTGERGGGVSMISGSKIGIKNSVLWGNTGPEGNQLWLCSNCIANIDHSLFNNGAGEVFITSGGAVNNTNSITLNPNFVNPVAPTSGNTPNTDGDYQLQTSSPAVDAGLNSHLPAGINTDLSGSKRIVKGSVNSTETIDMGAYEFAGDGSENSPFLISNRSQLENMNNNLSSHFKVVNDIDLSGVVYDKAVISFSTGTGSSFEGTKFTGNMDGDGFKIHNLNINGTTNNYIGLFGHIGTGAVVHNLHLENCSITGDQYVGSLAGRMDGVNPLIDSIQSAGSVNGTNFVGGLIGSITGPTMLISQCVSSAQVNGQTYVGGLLGYNDGGAVEQSFASGNAEGISYIGGFMGENNAGNISDCYARGSVTGSDRTAGLVGENSNSGVVINSFSTGQVNASGFGSGGLIGNNSSGTIFNSFWDFQTSGKAISSGGTGETTANMKIQSTFTGAGWDFAGESANGNDDYWNIASYLNDGYPVLSWQYFPPTDSIAGNALEFNGIDEYVTVGNDESFDLGNVLTIEAWIKPGEKSTRQGIFSSSFNNSDGAFRLEIGSANGGTKRVAVYGINTWVAQTGDNAYSNDQWTHIAYVRTGSGAGTHTIYVNGIAQALISDSPYEFIDNTSNKVIGSGTSGDQFFKGVMDEVRIWNVALTQQQIRQNMYRTLKGDETGLVSYYQFNIASDTKTNDNISLNNGTLVNLDSDAFKASTAPVPFISIGDGNWINAANWQNGQGYPVHAWSRVKINSDITLEEHKEVIEVTINDGKSLTVNPLYDLIISGEQEN